jgi:hypothetical protein
MVEDPKALSVNPPAEEKQLEKILLPCRRFYNNGVCFFFFFFLVALAFELREFAC